MLQQRKLLMRPKVAIHALISVGKQAFGCQAAHFKQVRKTDLELFGGQQADFPKNDHQCGRNTPSSLLNLLGVGFIKMAQRYFPGVARIGRHPLGAAPFPGVYQVQFHLAFGKVKIHR